MPSSTVAPTIHVDHLPTEKALLVLVGSKPASVTDDLAIQDAIHDVDASMFSSLPLFYLVARHELQGKTSIPLC